MAEPVEDRAGQHPQRQVLSESDVTFRGLSILLHLLSVAVIAFLIVQHGFPSIAKETDWVLASLTLFYVAVSFGMLRVIRSQVILSRQTAEQQLRAYVGVNEIHMSVIDERGLRYVAEVVIKNFGVTPARDVVHYCTMTPSGYPSPTLPEIDVTSDEVQHPHRSVLFPTNTVVTAPRHIVVLLGENERMYVHGLVTYVDIFGRCHKTRYRYFLAVRGLIIGNRVGLSLCPDGNTLT